MKQETLGYTMIYKTNDGTRSTRVRKSRPLGVFNGEYMVEFWAYGTPDNDIRGTHGLGCKTYSTMEKAIAAAKRYIKQWDN